jgi:hypothetical protein
MPDVERLQKLVDRLRELSAREKVPWTETADEGSFQATLHGGVVTIADEQGGEPYGEFVRRYVVRFYDPAGKLLDSATSTDFAGQTFSGGKEALGALSDLYEMARRKALKVDEALDELLRSL